MKYKMPKISTDAITYEPVPGKSPPQLHPGYRRDPDNPWRQISDWTPCQHRKMKSSQRECGRALITQLCNCKECPVFSMIVNPTVCAFCEYSDE